MVVLMQVSSPTRWDFQVVDHGAAGGTRHEEPVPDFEPDSVQNCDIRRAAHRWADYLKSLGPQGPCRFDPGRGHLFSAAGNKIFSGACAHHYSTASPRAIVKVS